MIAGPEIAWMVTSAFAIGIGIGSLLRERIDADQAISASPSTRWQKAIIDAKARAEKKKLIEK